MMMKPLAELVLTPANTEPLPYPAPAESQDMQIMGRGRLLTIHDVEAVFFGRRSAKWIKQHVAPEKRILIGELWCIWESDLRDYLDAQRGLPSPKRRAHLLKNSPMRSLIDEAVARRNKERGREKRARNTVAQ